MENNNESAMYELRLALYDMIKVTKALIENRGTLLNARKRIEAAEIILNQHFKITDVLRAEMPETEGDALKAQTEAVTEVFVPCAEDDQRACGSYASVDGRSLCYVREAKVVLIGHGKPELESPNANHQELKDENKALRRWKMEAAELLTKIHSYAHKHLEIKLGESVVDFVIKQAKERDELKEKGDKMKSGLEAIYTLPNPEENEYKVAFEYARNIANTALQALANWNKPGEGKEVPKADLGTCQECGTRQATSDYNGHQYYVCDPCDNRLSREFDDEYK